MPSWGELLQELQGTASSFDLLRRRYLAELHEHTGRNTIIYYSGWLQRAHGLSVAVSDSDKNGLMAAIYNLKDRSKGLDLVLHTPGGDIAATESIVDYLRSMFGDDIRAIVPQLAMSAGTMIACACKSILMGKHSSLGPIDPQLSFGGASVPAFSFVQERQFGLKEIQQDQSTGNFWALVWQKVPPTLLDQAMKAIEWSDGLVQEWLASGMFSERDDPAKCAKDVVAHLGNHQTNKTHNRHFSAKKCKEIGLVIEDLEDDDKLQDLVLSVHHACIHTFSNGQTRVAKIIENHLGHAFVHMQPE